MKNEELSAIESEILSYQNCDKGTLERVRELLQKLVEACQTSRFISREYIALHHEGDDAATVESRIISIARIAGVMSVGVSDVRRTEDGWRHTLTMTDAESFRLFDEENRKIANAPDLLMSNIFCMKCGSGHKRGECVSLPAEQPSVQTL